MIYSHQEITSHIEKETDLNEFQCKILVKGKWYKSTATRTRFLYWNFTCPVNGLIESVEYPIN